jgi:hypothetical protein
MVANDDPAIRHGADAPTSSATLRAHGFDRAASACGARLLDELGAGAPSLPSGIDGISRALSGISACARMHRERHCLGAVPRDDRGLPFAQHVELICRKAARRGSCDGGAMSKGSTVPAAGGFNSLLCPNCAQPMGHVRTIWRAFQDNLEVLECRRCDISVCQTAKPQPEERT